MKHTIVCYVFLLVSCQVGNEQNKIINNKIKIETRAKSNDSSLYEPTFRDVQKEFALIYKKEIDIDTSLKVKGQTLSVRFKHYCLFDTLVIPSKYNWAESPKNFYVHNFVSKLLVTKGNDTIVNTIIKKDMFNRLLDNSLVMYGVLLFPTYMGLNQKTNSIQIYYSISIPLTDVGQSVLLNIGLNGKIKVCAE